MFKAVCPYCSQDYLLDSALLGKSATCKRCRKVFLLKKEATAKTPPAAELHDDDSGFVLKPPTDKILVDQAARRQVPDAKLQKRFSPQSGMWNVGDVVLGIYEVKALADDIPYAEGGVGVVHRVYHREWDMDLAVKSPKPQVFQTENGKQSYEKEAQTWIELGLHPNIVTCYLVRRISNIPRLFAEFVSDGSLRDWIRDGRLYEGGSQAALLRILDIATQFAWGLEHAHRQKLLHLDVKPANVMMAGQTAKVTDFGLAQGITDSLDSDTHRHESEPSPGQSDPFLPAAAAGGMTPGYCSPEQYQAFHLAQQREFDRMPKITLQSDIWSWGVSVLSMFHGRPPCKKGGQTARKVFELYLKMDAEEPRPRMPEPIVELLYHCFEEDPEKRPSSMAEVADRLVESYKTVSGMDFPRPRPVNATWTPESINNRAASMLDLNKPEEAAELLKKALEMQPWHPEVTYNQALLAWRTGRMTDLETIERIETLAKTHTESSTARYALGLLQRERGNPASALDAFETALDMEAREDVHRALLATEKVAARSARCLERVMVPRGREDEIMVDDAGEFVLVITESEAFDLRETATGRVRNTFTPTPPDRREQFPGRVALSDDLLWELVREPSSDGFLLRRVGGAGATASTFRTITWKRYFGQKPQTKQRNLVTQDDVPWIAELKDSLVDLFSKETKKKVADLFGHEDTVTALAFSADGRYAVTGSLDQTLRIWELPSGRCLRTFTSLGGAVDALYFGPNNLSILSLIAGGSFRLWDVGVLCGRRQTFRAPLLLSHVASAEEVGRKQTEMNRYCDEIRRAVRDAEFAAALETVRKAGELDGWEAARKRLDTEGLWDVLARRTVRVAPEAVLCTHNFVGHHDTVSAIALSLDGNIVASAGRDHDIRVWNISEQKCIGILEGHFDWIRSIQMTMDAKFLVSGSWDMSVRIWNIGSGHCLRKFEEKIRSLTRISLNPQGRILAIASGQGAVVFWDVLADRVEGRFLAHSGSVNAVRYNRNGQYLVTGGDDNLVCVWKPGDDEPVRKISAHKAPVTEAVLSTDMRRIVSADRDGRIVCWNLLEDRMEFDLQAHFGDVTGLEILADDLFFLSAAKDMKVRLQGIRDKNVQRLIEGHPSPVQSLAADITGRRFVTGCEDAVVRVWDIYWDYAFPGWSPMTPEAESILKSLISLYCPDPEARERPHLDKAVLKRIFLEMEYRGFGMILPEEMRQTAVRLLENWNGPNGLPRC